MSNTRYHSIGLKVKEKQESNPGRQSDDRMGENSRGKANLKRCSVVSAMKVSSNSCKSLYFGIIVKVMHPGSKLVRVSKFSDMGVRVRGFSPDPPFAMFLH